MADGHQYAPRDKKSIAIISMWALGHVGAAAVVHAYRTKLQALLCQVGPHHLYPLSFVEAWLGVVWWGFLALLMVSRKVAL